MLTISLLGTPDIRIDGAPLAVDTRKAVALLAHLALEPGDHPRDALVDLLWPDTDVDRARSSLRRTLSTLRSALGGRWVGADRSVVALDRAGVTIDVEEFLTLADDRHDHGRTDTCPACLRDLPRAVALVRGDFMAGFSSRDAAPFEAWMTERAEHLRRRLDDVHARLAVARAGEGDYPGAMESAAARIALDPLNEQAHRSMMLYAAWAGDRAGAVDAYRRLVATLDAELGTPPLEETTELYEAILEEDLPRAPAPPRRPVARTTRHAAPAIPLVGRDPELAGLLDTLGRPGSVAVVRGAPGVGVTRLLAEVAARLRTGGAAVLTARGAAATGTIPYGVVHEAIAPALDDPGLRARIDALPDGVLAEASRVFPGLGDRQPPSGSSRARLLDALVRIVAALPGPVVVVDDAGLVDPPSAEALAFLAARAGRTGVRVLTGATAAPAADPAVEAMLADLARRGEQVALGPLDTAAVETLATALGHTGDAADLARRSGGLPLFVVEAVRAGGMSDELRRVIRERLADLDGAALQALQAMAVLGSPGTPAILVSTSGRTADETDEAIDALVRRNLAVEGEDGSIAVAHEMLRDVVAGTMTAARRRLLHRRAAAALATAGADAARIAHHHREAGNDAEAARWFATAAHQASGLLAHREAIGHAEAALAAGHPDRSGLHAAIGDAAVRDGWYDRAVGAYETALAAGHPDIAGIEHRLGEVHRRLRRWDLADAHYARAEVAAGDDESRAIVGADRAYVAHQRGSDPGPLVDAVQRLARASGSDRAIARAANVAGLVAADRAQRLDHLRVALDHATDPGERMAVLNNLAAASPPAEAVVLARQALEIAVDLGDRHLMAALHNTLADALHAAGESTASMAALTEAVALFAEISGRGAEPWNPEVWLLTEW